MYCILDADSHSFLIFILTSIYSLLAEFGHNLNLNINNYNIQKPLIEYLFYRRNGLLQSCSKSGVRYLSYIVNYNNFLSMY